MPGRAPLVSIGLPVFNGARFLERALDSLRAQEYPALEIVVSDNASTDATYEICQRHAAEDPRIRVIRQPKNQGPHANFETVLEEARGAYFMWAADDDVWLPTFVSRLVAELEAHPEAGAAMCAIKRVQENGRPLDELRFGGADDLATKTAIQRGLVLLTPKKHSLFIYGLFRTSIAKRAIGHFPRALGGDRMLMFHFALATPMRYVDEFLYIRTHRPSHADAYIEESRSLRARFRQFMTFCKAFVRTPIVPRTVKLTFPLFAAAYAGFLLRKEAYEVKSRLKELMVRVRHETRELNAMALRVQALVRRAFRGQWERAAIGLACLVAVLGFVTSLQERANSGWFSSVTTLFLLWALAALGLASIGFALIKIMRYRRLWLRDRAMLSRMSDQLDEMTQRQRGTEKVLKYSTDLLLSPPQVDERAEEEAWPYGLNKQNIVRKQIAFAQQLEASRIRELYLQEIFAGIDEVSLPIGAINELSGHPNKADMLYVCAIAKLRGAKNIFEFGTYQGRTTYHLALTSDETRVTTIDLPPNPDWAYSKYNGIYFRGKPASERITQIYQDSRTLDTGPLNRQFDFVFVDADHSYEAVKNDTLKAFEMLKRGGIIMWHDYAPKSAGLVEYIRDFTRDHLPLFRIRRTCLLLHIDGVDPMSFKPLPMLPSLELAHQSSDPFQVEQIYHH